MRILVVNDDGIEAKGIQTLARLAKEFGEVWVVAPSSQCSAMSHRITVHDKIPIKKAEFPVEGVRAYSVGGTPADCVKMALEVLMEEKPDIVFSGINHGYNTGYDISYSGTVGAAMDALQYGIPAIAYSAKMGGSFSTAEHFFSMVTRGILDQEPTRTEVWNVNFPGCQPQEVKGVLWDRFPARTEYYLDHFEVEKIDEDTLLTDMVNIEFCPQAEEGSDIQALNQNCISIGKIRSFVL